MQSPTVVFLIDQTNVSGTDGKEYSDLLSTIGATIVSKFTRLRIGGRSCITFLIYENIVYRMDCCQQTWIPCIGFSTIAYAFYLCDICIEQSKDIDTACTKCHIGKSQCYTKKILSMISRQMFKNGQRHIDSVGNNLMKPEL